MLPLSIRATAGFLSLEDRLGELPSSNGRPEFDVNAAWDALFRLLDCDDSEPLTDYFFDQPPREGFAPADRVDDVAEDFENLVRAFKKRTGGLELSLYGGPDCWHFVVDNSVQLTPATEAANLAGDGIGRIHWLTGD